ncbi:MAG: flagellar hook-associated protein FlgK [Nocardioides sp.]|nr:flagellar hook-associated protein FlgK [Nocardioides sp.]
MSGSFASLNTALTALRYQRVTLDIASNNVANASTDGYTRRRAVGESLGASAVPARWSRLPEGLDAVGGGVGVATIDRLADGLLDARARTEHGRQQYLDVRAGVLERVESGIGEPGTTGLSAALSSYRSSWNDLTSSPASSAARGQVLARGAALVDAVHAQAASLDSEAATQRATLLSTVAEVNTVAVELAAANKALAAASLDGVDNGDLADQRDRLALRLADLTGGKATARVDGGFDVSVGGVPLVNGQTAGRLVVTSGVTPTGGADGSPVVLSVVSGSPATTTQTSGMSGRLGATADLIDITLPAYVAGLGAVATTLADEVNALHRTGYDAAGTTGRDFFSHTPGDAARTLRVALTGPGQVAASALAGGVVDGSRADRLSEAGTAEDAYIRLVTDFGTQVSSSQRLAATQGLLTTQVDSARQQLSGVNLDEEMVAMLAAQRGYEAAARVMSVVDSVLDTLINRTGIG